MFNKDSELKELLLQIDNRQLDKVNEILSKRCLHTNSAFVMVIFRNGTEHVQRKCYDCGNRYGKFHSKYQFLKQLLDIVDLRDSIRESCDKCGSFNGTEVHHITYRPEKISNLCIDCHRLITHMNTKYAFNQNCSMSNEQRLEVWDEFCGLSLEEVSNV